MIDPITTSYQAVQAYYIPVPQVRNAQEKRENASTEYSGHIQNNIDKLMQTHSCLWNVALKQKYYVACFTHDIGS